MRFADQIVNYLDDVTQRVRNGLGNDLLGLYAYGSAAYEDLVEGQSDVDVLGITARTIPDATCELLAREIAHPELFCPASGLEFILVEQECASTIPDDPPFGLAVTTGKNWGTEVEYKGVYSELPLDLEICKRSGVSLYGPPPDSLIGEVSNDRLITILRDIIKWHKDHLFDPFHDPWGHYAVLNACRARRFAADGVLCSKTEGANWLLEREPSQQIVIEALDIRHDRNKEKLGRDAIEQFLSETEAIMTGQGIR